MTREQLMTCMAAVLTTALETEPEPFPESLAYLATGADLTKWEQVKHMLTGSGLITTAGHAIQLTDKGRALARQCAGLLAH